MAYDIGTARGVIEMEYNGRGIDEAKKDVEDLGKKGESAGINWDKTAKGMAVAGTTIAGGLAFGVNAAANFEERLSAIQAVSGASAKEMDQLSKKALQLGKDTSFSATESALAMEELVKAGLTTEDVLNGAADATVALAAAGEVDLPTAATIASNAMNQFQLSAQDLPHIADLLAGAANVSAIGVEDLGESLKYVGPVANATGVSIEDVSTALAVLGNEGVKGGAAGTALRSILSNLTPTTKRATEEFKKLGLITKEGKNLFVDANGSIKPLAEVMDILNKKTKNLSDTEKNTFAKKAFGLETLSAVAILSKQTGDSFDKMAGDIGKVKAADVAATRLDNMKGSLEQLKGSLETMGILMGNVLIPALTALIDKLTGVLDWFLSLDSGTQKVITIILALAAGLLLAGAAIIKTVQFFQKLNAAIKVLQATKAGAGIGKLTSSIASAGKAAAKWAAQMVAAAAKAVAAAARAAAAWVANMAKIAAAQLRAAAAGLAAWAKAAAASVAAALRSAAAWVASTARTVAALVAQGVAFVAQKAAMLAYSIATKAAAAAQWLLNAAMAANPITLIIIAIVALVAALVLAYQKSETFRAIVQAVWEFIKTFVTAAVNAVKDVIMVVFNAIKAYITTVFNVYKTIITTVFKVIKTVITTYVNAYKTVITTVFNAIKTVITTVMNAIKSVVSTVWNAIKSVVTTTVNAVKNAVTGAWNAVKNVTSNVFGKVVEIVREKVKAVIDKVKEIKSKIVDFFKGAGEWLYDAGKKIIGGLIDGIKAMAGKVKDAMGGITKGIGKLIPGSPVKEGALKVLNHGHSGGEIVKMLISGIEDMGPKLREALTTYTDVLPADVLPNATPTYPSQVNGQKQDTQAIRDLLDGWEQVADKIDEQTEKLSDDLKDNGKQVLTLKRQGAI